MLAARARIEPDARRAASAAAVQRARPFLTGVTTLALYAPFRGELDPTGLEAEVQTIVYPRVEPDGLVFVEARHDELVPGRWGLLEPEGEPVDIAAIDAFIVPGVAFTRRGDRLGYGAGYYDRALGAAKGRFVGFAFDAQIVDALPVAAYDVPMDVVVTETRVLGRSSDA